jgi:lysozyme
MAPLRWDRLCWLGGQAHMGNGGGIQSGLNMSIAWSAVVLLFLPAIAASAAVICPSGSTLQGIDVSLAQGVINWNQVSGAGKAFAFARVSDGSLVDLSFAGNYAAIKAAGMIRGAYQHFEPAQDPVVQANIVLAAIGTPVAGDLPPALDVETNGGLGPAALVAAIQSWVSTIQAAIGRPPIIYTVAGFWDPSVASTEFSSYPLWVASVGGVCPTTTAAWSSWAFWQYSFNGSVPGVDGSVDLDEFNGSASALLALATPAGPSPPPIPALSHSMLALVAFLLACLGTATVRRRSIRSPR